MLFFWEWVFGSVIKLILVRLQCKISSHTHRHQINKSFTYLILFMLKTFLLCYRCLIYARNLEKKQSWKLLLKEIEFLRGVKVEMGKSQDTKTVYKNTKHLSTYLSQICQIPTVLILDTVSMAYIFLGNYLVINSPKAYRTCEWKPNRTFSSMFCIFFFNNKKSDFALSFSRHIKKYYFVIDYFWSRDFCI